MTNETPPPQIPVSVRLKPDEAALFLVVSQTLERNEGRKLSQADVFRTCLRTQADKLKIG